MTVTDVLRRATELPPQTKRGKRTKLDLRPPATDAEIKSLESRLPCPLPDEIRELLSYWVVSVKWWKSRDASSERVTTLLPDRLSACPSIRRVL